jgi:HEPN domain-containing protein
MKQVIDQALRFLRLAERDYKAFLILKNEKEVGSSIIYFHAQQAIEKFLKAVLISKKIDPKKTHDLNELAYLLQRHNLVLPVSIEKLSTLTPYAVIFRYDDMEIETISREEAEAMIKTVQQWAESMVLPR